MKNISKIIVLIMLTAVTNSFSQTDEMKNDIALIKKNLVDSKESLKKYEWIETTTVFIKGEQKSVKQNQCYYGVDGTLTKVETGGSVKGKTPGGIRGRIAENKKEEMGEYIEKALKQIKSYIPPQPEKIQKVYDAGKTGIQILEPGKKFKLDFSDYNQAGDLVSIKLDRTSKLLMGYSVKTFVESATDVVNFDITLKALPDGTSYPAEIVFNSPGQDLKIVMVNSGYKVGAGH